MHPVWRTRNVKKLKPLQVTVLCQWCWDTEAVSPLQGELGMVVTAVQISLSVEYPQGPHSRLLGKSVSRSHGGDSAPLSSDP